MAAINYFLQVQGIEGESTNAQFPGAIEIESFSWGATNSGSLGTGGGGGVGKVTVSDFSVVKRVDKASPQLFLACATGRHIPTITLVARRSNPNGVFLQYQLKDVLVSSFQEAGTEGDLPLEEISFNFSRIEFTYVPQLANGQPGQPITVNFDRRSLSAG